MKSKLQWVLIIIAGGYLIGATLIRRLLQGG